MKSGKLQCSLVIRVPYTWGPTDKGLLLIESTFSVFWLYLSLWKVKQQFNLLLTSLNDTFLHLEERQNASIDATLTLKLWLMKSRDCGLRDDAPLRRSEETQEPNGNSHYLPPSPKTLLKGAMGWARSVIPWKLDKLLKHRINDAGRYKNRMQTWEFVALPVVKV